ncbi:hypothetical protein IMG5_196630 [Ichthyophthirius multifiliis]|uniref:Uncharacterized protein n=1 Tax=Ichthyophthirius multifiliis TaxID=5932 RepID=G0R569_ICHMU|nr:hypothetical protein IMG5_196630 [Ichthyophthirius multifiliis]EGR27393.1 hypothetical protein IMG5_196630 [Ichthyophthirius multifiliis]|eukprot:XP_004024277.1 hypothetical protein IMG5_196630 [Ichthyophthirius multifiliis]
MKKLLYYDSDLQSDNPPNFDSDNEPPKDIIRESKLLIKTDLNRVYKEIWQVLFFFKKKENNLKIGQGLPKPAKYDEVKVKFIEIDNPDCEENNKFPQGQLFQNYFDKLNKQDLLQFNLGKNKYEEWFDNIVESMKKNEICFIFMEYLKFDDNHMKILDYKKFYLFYLEDWTTVIDLRQDMNFLKKVIQKGQGIQRCEKSDEVIFNYKLSKEQEIIDERNSDEIIRVDKLMEIGFSDCIWRVMSSMKDQEIVECYITQKGFLDLENENFKEKYKINQSDEIHVYKLELNLKKLISIEDILGNGQLIKKQLFKGICTSKPEKDCRIFFSLKIEVNQQIIYDSGTINNLEEQVKNSNMSKIEFLENQKNCWKYILDEYKISKLLQKTLRRMKKSEECQIECKDNIYIQYGDDFKIIKEKCENQIPQSIVYYIKLFDFTDSKNTYTMTIDEKFNKVKEKISWIKIHQSKQNNQFNFYQQFYLYNKIRKIIIKKLLEYLNLQIIIFYQDNLLNKNYFQQNKLFFLLKEKNWFNNNYIFIKIVQNIKFVKYQFMFDEIIKMERISRVL